MNPLVLFIKYLTVLKLKCNVTIAKKYFSADNLVLFWSLNLGYYFYGRKEKVCQSRGRSKL